MSIFVLTVTLNSLVRSLKCVLVSAFAEAISDFSAILLQSVFFYDPTLLRAQRNYFVPSSDDKSDPAVFEVVREFLKHFS